MRIKFASCLPCNIRTKISHLSYYFFSEITVSPPFPVDTPNHSVSYTYLDTSGRPTVHLIKNACTERHALEVFISYKYTSTNLVKKPLVIAGAMMSLFLIGAALRRVRWSFI